MCAGRQADGFAALRPFARRGSPVAREDLIEPRHLARAEPCAKLRLDLGECRARLRDHPLAIGRVADDLLGAPHGIGLEAQEPDGFELARELGDRLARDRWIRTWIGGRVLGFTNLRLLTAIAQGRIPGPEGSLGKLVGTLLLSDIYNQAIDLLGAEGMLAASDAPVGGEWQDAFLGTQGLRVGGGTDQIQRNIIAERILGLPKDPVGA